MNTNLKESLVQFIMSVVKKYPERKPQINPVVYYSSFMMSIDEIQKAIPGKHKEKFEKEMASALFNYRKYFNPRNQYANEAISRFLSPRIQKVLADVWFSMSNNSKQEYLFKLKKNVLNEIRKEYLNPDSNLLFSMNNVPNKNIMSNFLFNRQNLMEKLVVEKQVMPLKKEAKAKENAKIQTLLKSLKKLNPNGQMGQAMYTARDHLKAAARNETNQKKIKNTRNNLLTNIEARYTSSKEQKEIEKFRTMLKEMQDGTRGKNLDNLDRSMPFKPWGRPIPSYRNNTGAYRPRNKNAVPAGLGDNWRYKFAF